MSCCTVLSLKAHLYVSCPVAYSSLSIYCCRPSKYSARIFSKVGLHSFPFVSDTFFSPINSTKQTECGAKCWVDSIWNSINVFQLSFRVKTSFFYQNNFTCVFINYFESCKKIPIETGVRLLQVLFYTVDRYNSVGIANRCGLESPGIEYRWGARLFATGLGFHTCSYTMVFGSVSRG